MLRVHSRIFRASSESQDKNVLAKLLVASNQIGCLLGKGGSIIAEMRKSTRAYIRILGKDQLPKGAAENEEVVQVCFLSCVFCTCSGIKHLDACVTMQWLL